MARLTLGPLVASVKGRFEGTTVRMTKYGPVLQKAHDPPPRLDSGSVAAKAQFSRAIHAWSTMGTDLQHTLRDLHREARHGSPGPWVTTWSRYESTSDWNHAFATHPEQQFIITHADTSGPYVRIWFDRVFASPWWYAHGLTWKFDGWFRPHGWFATALAATHDHVVVSQTTLPADAHCVVFPTQQAHPELLGLSDAIISPL